MLDAIVSKFSGRIKKGKGYNVICPTHSDKQPSLSINPGKDGRVVMHCQAGCSTKDILAAVALTERDLFPAHMQAARGSARDHPIAENGGARSRLTSYDYPDEAGTLLYQTVRKEPKGFFQRRPDGKGGWITNLNGTRRVLYRLPDLVNADKARTVLIVEGEKDADALAAIGELATCNPQGAGKWRDEYSETLKGRRCVILPDNDEPGEKHAQAVAKSLQNWASDVYILRLPGLPDKGDVSDWLAQGNTPEDLYALLTGADNIPIITSDTAIDGAIRNDESTSPSPIVVASDTAENGDSRSTLPRGFLISNRGVMFQGPANRDGEKPPQTFVCSPLRITADTCDAENESWGRRLQFHDAQKVKHDLVIPMSQLSGDGAELRARLMDAGLIIGATTEARQKFLRYLLSAEPQRHVLCVNRLGWHGDAFVLPDAVVSTTLEPDSILLQNVDRSANKFKTSGNLSDWQKSVARYCVGNSRLMFAACAAFASPLLPLTGERGGGFHLHGESSSGKTTALYVAGSIWGGRADKGFLDTWKSTGNGPRPWQSFTIIPCCCLTRSTKSAPMTSGKLYTRCQMGSANPE